MGNENSMQYAIKDVPEVNTQLLSVKSSDSEIEKIKQINVSFPTAIRTANFKIYEDNKPPENNAEHSSFDVDYDNNNKRTYQLVDYDFETDEECDFSSPDSDNDPTYEPMSHRDEYDITDFSDYHINETTVET
ncbi:hypothetical protein FQA39_LY11411 [Lamprigera yunnana]|nr:hypothetical protein FQA39_LY11411 [Lamprigera yunnana]